MTSEIYRDPAKLFLQNHSVEKVDDVKDYVRFLRETAKLPNTPPIDLSVLYKHFGMPLPALVALPGQQGTVIHKAGIPQILVEESDPRLRRRFTEAHEIIEALIHELPKTLPGEKAHENFFGSAKERICNIGAANLLMPEESFLPRLKISGVSIKAAEELADNYEVSLTSCLLRIADVLKGQVAVVFWKYKRSITDELRKVHHSQLALNIGQVIRTPQMRLRVEWGFGNYRNLFIPKNKSIPTDSSVYKAWHSNEVTAGTEVLPFGRYKNTAILENRPMNYNNTRGILSLIKSPNLDILSSTGLSQKTFA